MLNTYLKTDIVKQKLQTEPKTFLIDTHFNQDARATTRNEKSPLLARNLALVTSGELLILFSIKVNLLYLIYSTTWRCCLLHLIKQNYLLKTFLKTLNLMTQVSLYLFSHLDLTWNCIISPKMVKKVMMNVDLSKASGPDCIPVVVLKNCEPEFSYILAELSVSVLRSLVFQIIERFHQWFHQ